MNFRRTALICCFSSDESEASSLLARLSCNNLISLVNTETLALN